jgi:hypothetical protein
VATPVPLAIVAPAGSAPLTPPRALAPETRPAPPRASTTTAAAPAPQPIRVERTALSDPALANAGAPAGGARARAPGRPVPKAGDETTTAATHAAPAHPPAPVPGVPTSSTEPASVREACGNRRFFALAACMDRRCEEAHFRSSAECVAILARKANREGQAPN